MPPIWQPKDPEILRSWVDAIMEEASDKLSSWEIDFVESIDRQLRGGRVLSQKQEEILERIYAEKTS